VIAGLTPEGCGGAAECRLCVVRGAVAQAAGGREVYRQEARLELATEDGPREQFLKVTASPFDHQGGARVLLMLEDMTVQRRAERERVEKERLAGVLEMAGAAAHELSQPLMVLGGELELLLAQGAADDPARPALERLMAAAERMEKTVHQIQGVTTYQTTGYLDGSRIVDIGRASGQGSTGEEES